MRADHLESSIEVIEYKLLCALIVRHAHADDSHDGSTPALTMLAPGGVSLLANALERADISSVVQSDEFAQRHSCLPQSRVLYFDAYIVCRRRRTPNIAHELRL